MSKRITVRGAEEELRKEKKKETKKQTNKQTKTTEIETYKRLCMMQ